MNTEIKPIMFEKGNKYKCLKTLKLENKIYFEKDKDYNCNTNNCLITELGEENFITQNYLPYFFE